MRDPVTPSPQPAPERATDATAAGAAAASPAPSNGASATPAGEAEGPPPWAQFSVARGRFVRFVVVFSIFLALLATASIYWRWANVAEPSSYVVIYGSEAHNGTQIVVHSPDRPDAMATLSKDNQYTAVIFLHPGSYTITATLNGGQLVQQYFALGNRQARPIVLSTRPAAGTKDAARAGANDGR